MLSLNKRPCRIGSSINTRAEMHGEDSVTAIDIPVGEIYLEAEEFNALLQDPHAFTRFFDVKPGSPAQPSTPIIKSLRLADKIEGAEVTLGLAGQTSLKLVNCKLAKVTIEREVGGPRMLAQIQCVPKLDSTIARLMEKLNCEVSIELHVEGYGDQTKLPLEHKAEASASDRVDAGMSRTGRRIQAAAAKRARRKNGQAEAR